MKGEGGVGDDSISPSKGAGLIREKVMLKMKMLRN